MLTNDAFYPALSADAFTPANSWTSKDPERFLLLLNQLATIVLAKHGVDAADAAAAEAPAAAPAGDGALAEEAAHDEAAALEIADDPDVPSDAGK
jgi:hypothetical protein